MKKSTLFTILDAANVKIDDYRQGAGHFRDLVIGVGEDPKTLWAVREEIKNAGHSMVRVDICSVPEHKDCGRFFLTVESFWWGD